MPKRPAGFYMEEDLDRFRESNSFPLAPKQDTSDPSQSVSPMGHTETSRSYWQTAHGILSIILLSGAALYIYAPSTDSIGLVILVWALAPAYVCVLVAWIVLSMRRVGRSK